MGVTSLAFEPNNNFFVSVGRDCMLKLWDLRKGANYYSSEAHNNKINSVKFYNNYNSILTCGDDLSVKFWNLQYQNTKFGDSHPQNQENLNSNAHSDVHISDSQKLDLETRCNKDIQRTDLPVDGNIEKSFDQIIEQLNKLNLTTKLMEQRLVNNEKDVLKLTRFVTKDLEEYN